MRFRPSLRRTLQANALSMRAQADPQRRQALLDDPNVHERLKQSLRRQMQWEDEQIANAKADVQRPKRQPKPGRIPESVVLKAVLQALRLHPRVARAWRMNAGALTDGSRYISLGPTGIADVIGYLNDGRFLACEVKAPDGVVKPHQQAFLDHVRAAGGVAFVARGVEDVFKALGNGTPT